MPTELSPTVWILLPLLERNLDGTRASRPGPITAAAEETTVSAFTAASADTADRDAIRVFALGEYVEGAGYRGQRTKTPGSTVTALPEGAAFATITTLTANADADKARRIKSSGRNRGIQIAGRDLTTPVPPAPPLPPLPEPTLAPSPPPPP